MDFKVTAGLALILVGLWVSIYGAPKWPFHDLAFNKVEELKPGEPRFPALAAHYPADAIEHYTVTQGDEASLSLDSVRYRAMDGKVRRAVLYLGDEQSSAPTTKRLRQDLWAGAIAAIGQHTDDKALFLSWWDNAQRIDFFTGRDTWAMTPVATAFANRRERELWDRVAGPFNPDDARVRQLARWLAMDAKEALANMDKTLPADASVYLLACLDDLARVSEIERLSGKKLAFEASLFPTSSDIHAQIASVKRWAGEKGSGSYLVQQIPGQGIRAWRITDAATENSLLAKLLPFTGSLASPAPGLEPVYQSSWGGYLTIFEWQRKPPSDQPAVSR